ASRRGPCPIAGPSRRPPPRPPRIPAGRAWSAGRSPRRCSPSPLLALVESALSCLGSLAPAHPDEAGDGKQDTCDARELRDAERAQPVAVEAQRLDRESPHRVEPDIPEEEPARSIMPARPQPPREQREHGEVPQRFVEEGRMEALDGLVGERAMLGR